jgi:predicted small secreted protein
MKLTALLVSVVVLVVLVWSPYNTRRNRLAGQGSAGRRRLALRPLEKVLK